MKIQLLPSSFDEQGKASTEQRLTCFLIDDAVAIDAGSLALAANAHQRNTVRDILITHPHMDHVASLPIFIDDLFSVLEAPLRIHATDEVIGMLERDVFNWVVYPRFSELSNEFGPVVEYLPFSVGVEFKVAHLRITAVNVNHIVPTVGLIVTDGETTIAFSSDTAETEEFWHMVNRTRAVDALIIESSFPDSMAELAHVSRHFTPSSLKRELRKLAHRDLDILAVHVKPVYRDTVIKELAALDIPRLEVMEPGRTYEW